MHYKSLPSRKIKPAAVVNRRMHNRPTDVLLTDPAIMVMTDFSLLIPYCIEPLSNINAANHKMIACGVRLLFVTGNQNSLLGLVTASDILGEKPLLYLKERSGKRDDILTQDIMTPYEQLDVLHISDVENANVGDIIETAKMLGRQHLLVVETADGIEQIRGLFSTAQISRQMGQNLDIANRANTFAELEKAIASA